MQISDSSSMRHTSGSLPFKLQQKKKKKKKSTTDREKREKKGVEGGKKNTLKVIFQRTEEGEDVLRAILASLIFHHF